MTRQPTSTSLASASDIRDNLLQIPTRPAALRECLCSFLRFCVKATMPDFNATPSDLDRVVTTLLDRHPGDYAAAVRTWVEFWNQHMLLVMRSTLPLSTADLMKRIEAALSLHCGFNKQATVVEETLNEMALNRFQQSLYAFLCNACEIPLEESKTNVLPVFVTGARTLSELLDTRFVSQVKAARDELPKLWEQAKALAVTSYPLGDGACDSIVNWLKDFYLQNHRQPTTVLRGVDWGSEPSKSKEVLVSVSPESTVCFNLPLSVSELQQFFQDGGKFPVNLMLKASPEHRRQLMRQAVEALQVLVVTTATEFFTNSFFESRTSMGLSAGTDHLRSVLLPLMDYLARPQIKVQEAKILNSTRSLLDVIDTLLAAEAAEPNPA